MYIYSRSYGDIWYGNSHAFKWSAMIWLATFVHMYLQLHVMRVFESISNENVLPTYVFYISMTKKTEHFLQPVLLVDHQNIAELFVIKCYCSSCIICSGRLLTAHDYTAAARELKLSSCIYKWLIEALFLSYVAHDISINTIVLLRLKSDQTTYAADGQCSLSSFILSGSKTFHSSTWHWNWLCMNKPMITWIVCMVLSTSILCILLSRNEVECPVDEVEHQESGWEEYPWHDIDPFRTLGRISKEESVQAASSQLWSCLTWPWHVANIAVLNIVVVVVDHVVVELVVVVAVWSSDERVFVEWLELLDWQLVLSVIGDEVVLGLRLLVRGLKCWVAVLSALQPHNIYSTTITHPHATITTNSVRRIFFWPTKFIYFRPTELVFRPTEFVVTRQIMFWGCYWLCLWSLDSALLSYSVQFAMADASLTKNNTRKV